MLRHVETWVKFRQYGINLSRFTKSKVYFSFMQTINQPMHQFHLTTLKNKKIWYQVCFWCYYIIEKNIKKHWLKRPKAVLKNFLKVACCFGLVNCLKLFEIQLFFSISIISSIALKRWNFPDNLDFSGKIMAKIIIRSHFLSI